MSLSRYYYSIRALKLAQIRWRLQYAVSRKLHLRHPIEGILHAPYYLPLIKRAKFLWAPVGSRTNLIRLTFDILNSPVEFKGSVDWTAAGQARLWGYNLHYFDFLSVANASVGKQLIKDWIDRCHDGIGWESAPTSCRIINWIKFADERLSIAGDSTFLETLAGSICVQSDWLKRNLESDVDGNHLLKNSVALIFAGIFINESRYIESGKQLLLRTIEEQILPDGAHYERSPMYHSIVLMDLLDMANLEHQDKLFLNCLLRAISPALKFLRGIKHSDGQIALFNDSCFGVAPDPDSILSYAAKIFGQELECKPTNDPTAFMNSGYYVIPAKNWRMIVDAGEIGPECQPAHAHCDLLSFELSWGVHRIVVDSGNYDYSEGAIRTYCRSTRAHNTASVDGQEQSDMWKIFRVGRRAKPEGVNWVPDSEMTLMCASHNGFVKTLGVTHERTIAAFSQGFYFVLDRFTGKGSHHIESFLHFHPDCRLEPDGNCIKIHLDEKQADLLLLPSFGSFKIAEGWFCPSFGVQIRQKVLVLDITGSLPLTIAYCIGDLPQEHIRFDLVRSIVCFGDKKFSLKRQAV